MGTKRPMVRYGSSRWSRWATISPDPDIDPDDGYTVGVNQRIVPIEPASITINYECNSQTANQVEYDWQLMTRGVKKALEKIGRAHV